MKKIITLVAIMLITFSATSQNKKAKGNNNDCYIETAVTTFKLSEENKTKLSDLLTERLEQRAAVRRKIKRSEVSKEEGKSKTKTINQTYFKSFADLTGKPKKEIMSFEKETKKKCN
ncbi:hypothetical protein Q4512_13480 [Oceanihabitans sp. 2_MG-2023]|uniref:hypothetical protein n=1 Tax=Oceanihabitans sp. 2_MG-2023 TaxID=3062661 RepID=UPI0026E404B6|nr:hypothetical protein [Oceanihabitans sp. 2_MG-2023]MDO6597932.1 hypothetical protein [Oceanihabitans sp. 2_MG-2023]